MFRCRRFFRPVVLLSLAMGCSIVGYILVLQGDRSVQRVVSVANQDLRDFQPRHQGQGEVTHQENPPVLSDADKLGKIAGLLGVEAGAGGGYKDMQNKILLIEEILEKFRTNGEEKQASSVLKELQNVLQKGKEQNENLVSPTEKSKTQGVQVKNDIASILEHIEDVLEQPAVPPPPIPNIKLDIKPYIKDPHFKTSTCSKTASKIAEKSLWFKTRYIPDIKVFMDKEDINNFTNYYKLSHYGLPFGVKSQDRKLLAHVVNNPNFTNPDVYGGQRPACVRCAVVGCGGVLNGSNMGETIDAHDYVFRVNRALTKGRFAQDVGTRTSFYTFFPESQYAREIQNQSETKFFYTEFKTYDIDYADRMLRGLKPPALHSKKRNTSWNPPKPMLDVHKLKIVHPDFMRYVFTRFLDSKAYRPTTGALVVFLAIHLCDEVNMYGFGYDARFPMHYYDSTKVELTRASVGSHDVDNERQLWRKLTDENILYLYNRTDV
ncbi:alpha-N-acetylgalactosaminide alpha-2,6-sialyltransferase 2-like isoform X2 [Ptychodera flava]|uniref:alpha-N-acetylgalactosaminide alpha-2,6-sialyltransferase 2-like isoform X2 n=1 Tax=Ptychodera flava TaxID=63121 RepID=UPI00396A4A9E